MKKRIIFFSIVLILLMLNCELNVSKSKSSKKHTSSSSSSSNNSSYSAGDQKIYTAGGVSFVVVYVPGKTFKAGTDDSGSASVSNSYWIAQTETTYELWNTVYNWATSNEYTFANAGVQGDGVAAGETNQHPVTTINWSDAMVWTNALTEWYNAETGSSLTTVYNNSGSPVRDATDTAVCDAVIQDTGATGFRLLTSNEWELAARYISDANNDGDIADAGEYYPGDHASGDITSYCFPADGGTSAVFGNYAWYSGNSGTATHPVKTALPNALGIYDMSGNVWQWVFDANGANRTLRGGSWADAQNNLQVGYIFNIILPSFNGYHIGLRFAKNY